MKSIVSVYSILILLNLIPFVSNGQQALLASYMRSTKFEHTTELDYSIFELKANKEASEFKYIKSLSNVTRKSAKRKLSKDSIPRGLYYSIEKDIVFNSVTIMKKYYYTIDSQLVTKLLEWEIDTLGQTKEVLGFECHKATLTFRGRDYIAYFTKEVPYSVGPHKFVGLPGLVAEIYSTDGVFKFELTGLTYSNEELDLPNPFINGPTEPMLWEEYVKEKKRKQDLFVKKHNASDKEGFTYTMKTHELEIFQ